MTSHDPTNTGSGRCLQVQAGASPSPAPQLSPLNRYQVPKTSKLPQTQADLAVYVRDLHGLNHLRSNPRFSSHFLTFLVERLSSADILHCARR